ncbi:MAG: thiamine diphosphokinase [Erysipelotrichaceae bacterium]|nr:thiamine diphosphokinase [Erysipelotrichaceae bacterium]
MLCNVVCGFKPDISKLKEGFNIGVDAGALYLINKGIKVDVAIGDFDSINEEDFKLIKENVKEVIKLNPIKDDTDFEHTLKYVKEKGFTELEVYGCLGGRQDHGLLNIKLLYQSDLNISIIDEQNKIYRLKKGKHLIKKDGYKYLSILNFEKVVLELKGTFYPIEKTELKLSDNYTTSNEILNEECELTIHEGQILLIQSNDKTGI